VSLLYNQRSDEVLTTPPSPLTTPLLKGAASMANRKLTVEDRFWAKVVRREPTECWPWMGRVDLCGYGTMVAHRKSRRATHIAWEIANGRPFPVGLDAMHHCDNPTCVNPAHIKPATKKENMQDCVRKGRLKLNVVPGWQKSLTHCRRGHAFDETNTYMHPSGSRQCRICARACRRKWQVEKRPEYRRRLRAKLFGAHSGDGNE
jgi:hypothetical protein